MRSFDCFVRFLPVSDRRELNSYIFYMILLDTNLYLLQHFSPLENSVF